MFTKILRISIAALLIATAVSLADTPLHSDDHPNIPGYPASELVGYDSRIYDQSFIPTGTDLSTGNWVAGKFQWRAYRAPANVSGETLFRHYDQILGSAGFRVVHACVKSNCGNNFILNMLQSSNRNVSNLETWVNESAYYMAVRLQQNGVDQWVSLLIYSTPDDPRPLIRLETVEVAKPRSPQQLPSEVVGRQTLPGSSIGLAAGKSAEQGITDIAQLSGRVERETLIYGGDASPFELLASWLSSSKESGYVVDFYCGGIFCGPNFIAQVRQLNQQFPQAQAETWKMNSAYYFTALKNDNGIKTARAFISYLQADGRAVSHRVQVTSEPQKQRDSMPTPINPSTMSFQQDTENEMTKTLNRYGKIVVHDIQFQKNTAEIIGSTAQQAIDDIAVMLISTPSLSVYIDGHTDNFGPEEVNQALSLQRSRAVIKVLINTYGLKPERMEARGFGESQPLISNHTPQGRSKNRRIEVVYKTR